MYFSNVSKNRLQGTCVMYNVHVQHAVDVHAECDAAHDAVQDTVSNAALRLQTEG